MLAFAWRWGESDFRGSGLAPRIAASLCAGIGGHAGLADIDSLAFAYRALRSSPATAKAWRPAFLESGKIAVFDGYFDNADEICQALGVRRCDPSRLYGLAVERWGGEADQRIVGEYGAVFVEPDSGIIRLSRSPLRAPPIYYHQGERIVAAASVPRALFACGIDQRLNETRVADSALLNFTDSEASWFETVCRVPLGSIVELRRGRERLLRRYYDVLSLPELPAATDEDYLRRAGELLDEGVRACIGGFKKPGATLSGGLDSPQVAVRALAALPPGQRLPTFTFHPEPGYDGRIERAMTGNERPTVEAFADMHPGIEPHFTANQGYEHDHRWNELFHLMGAAPCGLCNMYVFHGLFSEARAQGCDVLLLAEWGNFTFSERGDWAFVEYFLQGKWRELRRALKGLRHDDRNLFMRLCVRTLSAFLPTPIWRFAKRFGALRGHNPVDLVQPLKAEYRVSSGAEGRRQAAGLLLDRYQPWNRRHALKLLFQNDDWETAEVYQAFEQMYGVAQRDPTAYRPFFEYCAGLPTRMFVRDGHTRWLGKQMAKGIMPDAQRENLVNGRWDADWHLRIGRRRQDFLAELDRLESDERMAAILDIPRLKTALTDWPEETELDQVKVYGPEMMVPRGLLTARFINYVEGRNQV